jgi:hypothetical protein
VLGAAAFFEGISFAIAFRQFKRLAGSTPFWEFLRRSKDPTTYTVLAEDAAALEQLRSSGAVAALVQVRRGSHPSYDCSLRRR